MWFDRKWLSTAPIKKSSLSVLRRVLSSEPGFNSIRQDLLKDVDDDFQLSQILKKKINKSVIDRSLKAHLHNRIIESIAGYNYGIAVNHTKELVSMGSSLTSRSLMELIKYNPERVYTSWELFQNYWKNEDGCLSDQVLLALLRKIVMDTTAAQLTTNDIVQSCYILQSIDNKQLVGEDVTSILTENIMRLKVSFLLPLVLETKKPSLEVFLANLDNLTPYQFFQVSTVYSITELVRNPLFLQKLLKVLGSDDNVMLQKEEKEALLSVVQYMKTFQPFDILQHYLNETHAKLTTPVFYHLLDVIRGEQIDLKDLNLAVLLLRLVGTYKGNIELQSQLYSDYKKFYANNGGRLVFEKFLAEVYKSYMNNDILLLEETQKTADASIELNSHTITKEVLMLAYSRFNVGMSLEIYNSLQGTEHGRDQLLHATESLICCYLANEDLGFARLVLDGSMQKNIFRKKSDLSYIKNCLSEYGNAKDNGTLEIFCKSLIQSRLKELSI